MYYGYEGHFDGNDNCVSCHAEVVIILTSTALQNSADSKLFAFVKIQYLELYVKSK